VEVKRINDLCLFTDEYSTLYLFSDIPLHRQQDSKRATLFTPKY